MTRPIDGYDIIRDHTNMSLRPECYSGRGATTGDLNSEILEKIHGRLKRGWGDKVAANFVQFIYDFDKLSATAFLNAFYQFCANGGEYETRPQTAADHIDVGPDMEDGRREFGAAIGMFAHLGGGNERDDTEAIRDPFLWRHRDEYTPDPEKEGKKTRHIYYGGWGD